MILYEVDFNQNIDKVKKQQDVKKQLIPAKKLKMINDIPHYIGQACSFYNNSEFVQALDCMNLALEIDENNSFSHFADGYLVGLIQLKLGNFELAKKHFLKALYLGCSLSVLPFLLQNCVLNKDFVLAERIRASFDKIMTVAPLSLVKDDKAPLYDKNFSVENLLNGFLQLYNHSSHGFDDRLYYMLQIIDPTNPYVMQIAQDKKLGNLKKSYPTNYSPVLYSERLNFIRSEIKKRKGDLNKINQKGLIRFLSECTSVDEFCYLIQEIFKKPNIPNGIVWQCEDFLFGTYNCKAKMVVFECIAGVCANLGKMDLGMVYKDCLVNVFDAYMITLLHMCNKKVMHAFVLGLFDFVNILIKDKSDFDFELRLKAILQNFMTDTTKGNINFNKISAEKLRKIFLIALTNFYSKGKTKELKMFEEENISLIKKLKLDFSIVNAVQNSKNPNLILLNR